jgi:hypothetical protein
MGVADHDQGVVGRGQGQHGVVGRDQGAGVAARVQLECGWRGQGAAGNNHGAAGWAQLGRGQVRLGVARVW